MPQDSIPHRLPKEEWDANPSERARANLFLQTRPLNERETWQVDPILKGLGLPYPNYTPQDPNPYTEGFYEPEFNYIAGAPNQLTHEATHALQTMGGVEHAPFPEKLYNPNISYKDYIRTMYDYGGPQALKQMGYDPNKFLPEQQATAAEDWYQHKGYPFMGRKAFPLSPQDMAGYAQFVQRMKDQVIQNELEQDKFNIGYPNSPYKPSYGYAFRQFARHPYEAMRSVFGTQP